MENWKERLLEVSFIYTGKDVRVIETITFDYDKLEDFISKELDKAREEGFKEGGRGMLEGFLKRLENRVETERSIKGEIELSKDLFKVYKMDINKDEDS